ncbi:MAG: MASE1 domain-containing protein [Planctomycetales bacterium]|nr:MASE1 domain-containing protein [Planctomycetales bacterium]
MAVIYYAAARLGLTLQLPDTNASPVWPPSGIGFAAVMLAGYRVWPGIAIGAFLANLHTLPSTAAGFATSCGICVGNTLEPVVGLFVLRRLVSVRNPLERARNVFRFVAAATAGCLIASTNGATNLWAWEIIPSALYRQAWLTWCLGDMAGLLILAPVIFMLFQKSDFDWTRSRTLEAVALFALLAAATQFLFGDYRDWIDLELMDSLAYAVVPGLAWAAFRFGPRETALAAALVSAVAIVNTSNESGPFYPQPARISSQQLRPTHALSATVASDFKQRLRAESLLMLQIFVLAIAITAAILAGAVTERNRSEQALRDLNATLELRVVERTAELNQANAALERSNQELDDFAYIASHDLKEPLRGINTYSGYLLEDYGDKLDAEGQSKLNTLQRLTRRMESLIESLLTYSRVGQTELAVQDTNLSEVLAEILDSLVVVLQERGVEIRIPQPLPILYCDRVRVGEVFRNLITNAMKYNESPEKWIEIGFCNGSAGDGDSGGNGALTKGSPTVFHVRDNGIGIREKHLNSVFKMFKRLNARDQYGGGTGVGLTIVKKIVERHGGRIWLESTFGEGTTFFFTLQQGPSDATSS